MRRVEIATRAAADLDDIYAFSVQTFGEGRADEYLLALDRAFARLAEQPGIAQSVEWIRPGYRRFPVGSHAIFFREPALRIRIVRVLHLRMDARRRL